tara:strand:+ start:60 stop:221 length:162 start_codon:yes stop_codon:yes gene_type:complete
MRTEAGAILQQTLNLNTLLNNGFSPTSSIEFPPLVLELIELKFPLQQVGQQNN